MPYIRLAKLSDLNEEERKARKNEEERKAREEAENKNYFKLYDKKADIFESHNLKAATDELDLISLHRGVIDELNDELSVVCHQFLSILNRSKLPAKAGTPSITIAHGGAGRDELAHSNHSDEREALGSSADHVVSEVGADSAC